jgi:hypothetical protein
MLTATTLIAFLDGFFAGLIAFGCIAYFLGKPVENDSDETATGDCFPVFGKVRGGVHRNSNRTER